MFSGDLELGQVVGSGNALVLPRRAREQHLYVCGGTGVGKSKFLERLIRQDIYDWPKTKSGLLLLDPHGALYDGLIDWLAYHNLDRPIIPIDLRRNDWILAYNVLRKRKVGNPSVVVDTFVEAMGYAAGQDDLRATPQFSQWAVNVVRALYDNGYTLAETNYLIDRTSAKIRRHMTTGLSESLSRQDWEFANKLSPEKFDDQIGSTIRRLGRFVRNERLRAMFGQVEASLDLGRALSEGQIILVSLARKNALVSAEDARTFATLLLSDLWTAAQENRDKAKKPKPFHVYLDEFQRFITPTMAEGLAEARGFGLHLTMAHQFPNQLLNRGEHGKRLFDEVMENAQSKVVFRLQNPENLRPLAHQLFTGVIDPDRIKNQIYATKVLDYREETEESHTSNTSRSSGGGKSRSESKGSGSTSRVKELGMSEDEADLATWNEQASASSGESEQWNESDGESVTTRNVQRPILGKELSSIERVSIDEQLFRSLQSLFVQEDRHCAVRIVGQRAPLFLRTFNLKAQGVTERRRDEYVEKQFKKCGFFLTMADAKKRLAERERLLVDAVDGDCVRDEATTAKRRIVGP